MSRKYIQKMSSFDLLTKEDEIRLSKVINSEEYSDRDRQRAREEMSSKNFRLVAKIAYKYSEKTGADVDDLISEGVRGLMKAIDKYDYESYQTRFSTFAVTWITQSIKLFLYKSSFINIPSSIVDKAKKMKMLMDAGINDESEIARILNVKKNEMNNMKMAIVSKVDLDQPVVDKDGKIATFGEIIEDENVKLADESLCDKEMSNKLMEAIEGLDDIQKDIVIKRWLNDSKINLSDLGEEYGMTGENIRLIEKKAFDILKSKLTEKS